MNRKPTPTLIPTTSDDADRSLELMFSKGEPFSSGEPSIPSISSTPTPHDPPTIPISRIVPSRWQPRTTFDPEPLLELATDIDRHGILTPIIVWRNEDNEFELIAGERRIRAATALNLAAGGYDLAKAIAAVAKDGFVPYRTHLSAAAVVPVRLISGSPEKLHEIALVDNLLREDLNPIEEARALQDLIDEYHYTQRDLAARIGKSQTWIAHRLNLLHLEPKLAAKLIAGDIDPSLARDLARIPAPAQAGVLHQIQTANLKSKKASTYIGKLLALADPDAWTAPDPGSRIIAHQLRQLPEGERVQRILKSETGTDITITPARPPERWVRDRITSALAAADTNFDRLWRQHAPAIDATCATCQYNPHRAAIADLRARAASDASYLIAASDYPTCDAAGNVTTCRAHLPLAAPTIAHLSGSLRDYIDRHGPDYPTVHLADDSRWANYVAGDIPEWLRLQNDYLATRVVERQQETVTAANVVAEAIQTYQARQTEIDPANPLSQPCARCALARPDGVCSILDAPPSHETWRIERRHRILDASGDHRIGRCEAYRLRSWSDLPPVPGQAALRLDDDLLIPLLRRLIQRIGPSWLNVARSGVYEPPDANDCIDYLARHLPDATPAQRLAILLLWRDPIIYSYSANIPDNAIKLHNPYLGETIAYTVT